MSQFKVGQIACHVTLFVVGLALSSPIVAAQSTKLEGLINSRNGDTMVVRATNSASVTVLLTDRTEVGQIQGVFKARRKQMSMAALIPGLAVKVEGTYNDKQQLVAKSVAFKGNDLEDAEKIEAGMHETKAQVAQNQEELQKQNAALKAQNDALQQQQAQLTEHQAKIAANKAAVDAAIARFGQLDDYYILDELTVYFDNGKVKVDPKYDHRRLHDRGERLRLLLRQRDSKPTAERGPRRCGDQFRGPERTHSPHQNASPRCDGREPPSRKRQDGGRAGRESSRRSACSAE